MSQAGNFGGSGTVPGDGMPPIPPGATVMDTPYAAPVQPAQAAAAPVGAGSAAAMQPPPSPYGGYGGAPPPPPPPGPYGYGPPPPQGGRGGGSQTIIMAVLGVLAVGGISAALYLGLKKEEPAPAPPPQAGPAGTTVVNIPGLPSGMVLPSSLPVFVPPGQTTTAQPVQQRPPTAATATATTTATGAAGHATIPVQGGTTQPTATTAPTTTAAPTTTTPSGARPPKIAH